MDVAGLERVDLLAGLSPDERATVARAAVLREFPGGRDHVYSAMERRDDG